MENKSLIRRKTRLSQDEPSHRESEPECDGVRTSIQGLGHPLEEAELDCGDQFLLDSFLFTILSEQLRDLAAEAELTNCNLQKDHYIY